MPPEGYCEWCSDTHEGMTCTEHQDQKRQWYIDNQHSCWQCRNWEAA